MDNEANYKFMKGFEFKSLVLSFGKRKNFNSIDELTYLVNNKMNY